jgi:hypothetical protein
MKPCKKTSCDQRRSKNPVQVARSPWFARFIGFIAIFGGMEIEKEVRPHPCPLPQERVNVDHPHGLRSLWLQLPFVSNFSLGKMGKPWIEFCSSSGKWFSFSPGEKVGMRASVNILAFEVVRNAPFHSKQRGTIYRYKTPVFITCYAFSRSFRFFRGGEGCPSLMFKVQSLKSVRVALVCYSSVLLGLARGRGAATLDFFSAGRRLILA